MRVGQFLVGDWVRGLGDKAPHSFFLGKVVQIHYTTLIGYVYRVDLLVNYDSEKIEKRITCYEVELEKAEPTEEELILWTTALLE